MTKQGIIAVRRTANARLVYLAHLGPNGMEFSLIENPPDWLWETVVGNCGRFAEVICDPQDGSPVQVTVR